SGEVREAVWSEFKLDPFIEPDAPVWIIPAARMKAKQEHRVPLTKGMLNIVEKAKERSDGAPFVFPGTKPGRPLSDMTLSKLVKELGFDADVHGFRTSFRTWAQEQTDYPREVAEAALAHTIRNKAEAAYARSNFLEKRRVMMAKWEKFLAG